MITCFGVNRSSNLKILFPLEVILIDLVLKVINAKGNYSKQIMFCLSPDKARCFFSFKPVLFAWFYLVEIKMIELLGFS